MKDKTCLENKFLADSSTKLFSARASQKKLDNAVARLEHLRTSGAPRQEVRTAECDWFGAEETLTMAKAAAEGRLSQAYEHALPAEIQIIKIGQWAFVGWQGEMFVDYALTVKKLFADTFIISCANGELQGYIVTKEAYDEGGYEASNALLSYKSGDIIVQKTLETVTNNVRSNGTRCRHRSGDKLFQSRSV